MIRQRVEESRRRSAIDGWRSDSNSRTTLDVPQLAFDLQSVGRSKGWGRAVIGVVLATSFAVLVRDVLRLRGVISLANALKPVDGPS